MKKTVEFSLFFFLTLCLFKRQFNTSELVIFWVVSRESEKGMENRKFISTVKFTALFQAVIKMVNRLIAILCAETPLNKEYQKWLLFLPSFSVWESTEQTGDG